MKRKPPTMRNIGIDLDAQALADFACDYPVELVRGGCHEFLSTSEVNRNTPSGTLIHRT